MPNETLWILFVLLDLSGVVIIHRLFGRAGLMGLIVFNLILANIQVLKTVELFGLTTTLGNILYGSTFLTTDLLGEFHGPREARRGVFLGFATLLMAAAYMHIGLAFTPSPSDFAHPHMQVVFSLLPRVAGASLLAYLVSQLHDVWLYHLLRRRTGGRLLWLRNLASTAASQALDTGIFCTAAFAGVFSGDVFWQILATTYVMKLLVALLDTPFIYLARRLRPADS